MSRISWPEQSWKPKSISQAGDECIDAGHHPNGCFGTVESIGASGHGADLVVETFVLAVGQASDDGIVDTFDMALNRVAALMNGAMPLVAAVWRHWWIICLTSVVSRSPANTSRSDSLSW